jgi:hypothetical protein
MPAKDEDESEIGLRGRRRRLGRRRRNSHGDEQEQEPGAHDPTMQPREGGAQARTRNEGIEPGPLPAQAAGMPDQKAHDPLHGVTLERVVTELAGHFGWPELGQQVPVRCFLFDPSVKSSLTFLRKTPWARTRVEEIYVRWKAQG